MSDAPERIYLNLGNEETTYAEAVNAGWEVSWCEDQQDEWDVEYVRVDLYEQLQAEVERLREQCRGVLNKRGNEYGKES